MRESGAMGGLWGLLESDNRVGLLCVAWLIQFQCRQHTASHWALLGILDVSVARQSFPTSWDF